MHGASRAGEGVGRTYGPLAGEGESSSPEGSSNVIPRSAATRDLPRERASTGWQRLAGDLGGSLDSARWASLGMTGRSGGYAASLRVTGNVDVMGIDSASR